MIKKSPHWLQWLFLDRVCSRFDGLWLGSAVLLLAVDRPGSAITVFLLGAFASGWLTGKAAKAGELS